MRAYTVLRAVIIRSLTTYFVLVIDLESLVIPRWVAESEIASSSSLVDQKFVLLSLKTKMVDFCSLNRYRCLLACAA